MRGQVTIFIILGLLIVFAGGFLLYVVSQSSEQYNTEAQALILEELRATTTIGASMEACLNDAAGESIKFLGSQGGYLRKDSGVVASSVGSLQLDAVNARGDFDSDGRANFVLVGSGSNTQWLSVWIRNQELNEYNNQANGIKPQYFGTLGSSSFGIYPCRLPSSLAAFFGINSAQNLPQCANTFSLSTRVETFTYDENQRIGGSSLALCSDKQPEGCSGSDCTCFCDSSTQDCSLSLQSSMEDYIDKYFSRCFDNIEVAGYDLELRESNVEVVMNEQSVGVLATPIIDVVASASSVDEKVRIVYPTIQAKHLGVSLKTFMESLWNVIDRAQENEKTTLTFNATEKLLEIPMVSFVKQEPYEYNGINYYLYTLTLSGPSGEIYGEPWEFKFAVEDRLPVLSGIGTNIQLNNFQNFRTLRIYQPSVTTPAICAVDPDDLEVDITAERNSGPTLVTINENLANAVAPVSCSTFSLSQMSKTGDYYFTFKALDDNSDSKIQETYDYDKLKVEVRCAINPNNPACSAFGNDAGYCLQNGNDAGSCTPDCNTYFRNLNGDSEQYCNSETSATCVGNIVSALSCGNSQLTCCSEWQILPVCDDVNSPQSSNQKAITEDCMCQSQYGSESLTHDANKNAYCCNSNTEKRTPLFSTFGFNSQYPVCITGGSIYLGTPYMLPQNAFDSYFPSQLAVGVVKQTSPAVIIGEGNVVDHSIIGSSDLPPSCTYGSSQLWHKIDVSLSFSEAPNPNTINRIEFWFQAPGTQNSMC